MAIEQKKFKKLYKELQYQKSEYEYVVEILKEAHLEFEQYYRDYCLEREIDQDNLNEKNKEKVDKLIPKPKLQEHDEQGLLKLERQEFIDNTDSKQFKKIYREIAKVLHPDVGGDEAEFKKLSDSLANKDWSILLELSERYNIDIGDHKEINKILIKKIEHIKKKIEIEKSTYSWSLYQCEDNETCKGNVVKKFLKHLFDYGDYT